MENRQNILQPIIMNYRYLFRFILNFLEFSCPGNIWFEDIDNSSYINSIICQIYRFIMIIIWLKNSKNLILIHFWLKMIHELSEIHLLIVFRQCCDRFLIKTINSFIFLSISFKLMNIRIFLIILIKC